MLGFAAPKSACNSSLSSAATGSKITHLSSELSLLPPGTITNRDLSSIGCAVVVSGGVIKSNDSRRVIDSDILSKRCSRA